MPESPVLRRPKKLDANGSAESTLIPAEGGTITRRGKGADYRIEDRGYQTPCWIWQRSFDDKGYGRVYTPRGGCGAHREYYRLATRQDITGLHVHHRCKVTACVNPTHLEAKAPVPHIAEHKQEDSPLTWDDVRDIRRRAHGDVFPIELMAEFGISRQSIGQIILNQSWVDEAYEPPTLQRICEGPGCSEAYTPVRAKQRFCTADCRIRWNARNSYLLARARQGVPLSAPVRSYRKAA